jgi:5-hydroxyisourate hydrolase-like protein (transthyretin family)
MLKLAKAQLVATILSVAVLAYACGTVAAAVRIEGQVQAGGGPVASSTVTLWAANAGDPQQLAQTKTDAGGRFTLKSNATPGSDVSLYVIAKGGQATVNKASRNNPAITLLSVLGNMPPAKVVINEMTTVASVWTNAQFIDGTVIKGPALSLRIAAGNVPISSIFKRAAGGPLFRTRSIAARHQRWPTSRRWPTCLRAAPPL